ncbi:hypothetical protein SEA_JPICKLES_160 [Mycobacterium phage JPickles]|uniref:Uncharacterized protein n=1 Tax=Mycobacterium phage Drazdys TaxID=1034132 RepID=G1BT51_9CAUD|nr:hypothetical protein DRAZDYS_163 [Mycobacterium phage Drazdys]AVI04752.1 hypothetical protein SEA_LIFESAVOR_161 [Mycobacterium phage LifeSavor]AWY09769.1 hypothetical protein SEA_DEREK_162 [Mycobacterium phage Derek]QAY08105.1 hypothetical protein SEA_EMMAELYSIA_163 [Mycobacterium phage EmmaElysia]QAY11858.1 hypothetical protein SEA_ADING_164 [Mycobacterium phage Ading]QAY13866.1 hypothetical protein SEA_ESSENCE_160 [Mycobacterium phage Essence]QFP98178.1 hypothetical protein SEA_JPICKLES_
MKPTPASHQGSCIISIQMTDLDIIERVAKMVDKKIYRPRKRQEHWKQCYQVVVRGESARYWMTRLRPLMGERRRGQIDEALRSSATPSRKRALLEHDAQSLLLEFASGVPAPDLAKKYGIARESVYHLAKRRGVTRPSQVTELVV